MNFSVPELEPKITKEFLLSKNSEETYMSTYLGIPISKTLVRNPLRNDRKPTASFHRNSSGELIFHDFGIGFNENFIGVVMHLNQCTYQKALQIIAEDFGYIERTKNRQPIKLKITNEKEIKTMEKTLKIEGMMCGHCEMHVKKALEAIDGVKKAEVSHKSGTAVVTLEKDVPDGVLKQAVIDQGYKVTDIQ